MSASWDRHFIEELLASSDYRAFLRLFFEAGTRPRSSPRPCSYAELSRRAGFASRAYIRDIVHGSKRVSAANIDRIASGLRLKGALREYFYALVEQEGTRVKPSRRLDSTLDRAAALEALRHKALKNHLVRELSVGSEFLSGKASPHYSLIPLVYAASGTVEAGATLAELQLRTRLPKSKLQPAIDVMLDLGLFRMREDRYLPCDAHIAIDRLGGNAHFRADFERAIQLARQRFPYQAESKRALFLSSTFCVREKDLAALRTRLRTLILEFVNTAEEPTGDCVAEIVVGFSSNAL